MGSLLLIMILTPLLGSFFNGLVLRSKSPTVSGAVATLCAGISFACAVSLFFSLSQTGPIHIAFDWFSSGDLNVKWGFTFDQLTAVMALVVTGIGTLIHLYSVGYMSHEPTPSRYFAYLNLFLFNMLALISADSLIGLFVGWEGVGLCSYLLIGYWFQDTEKAFAGMKAFLVNRIGDACFLIGVFLLFWTLGTLEFTALADKIAKTSELSLTTLSLAAFFLFLGATGKSAQIPLYVWLPDAMAGPTPVSALIHAATMVTAGIYLLARMQFLFSLTADVNLFIATIGISTSLLAAFIATSQRDIKKVLAYSTVSQLGLMFLALGSKNYFAAIFHVMTHAFFKACLFLGAGSVIHALDGEQDITQMGGLKKKLPVTFWTFAISTAAICGIPPLAGFFSKDTVLFSALGIEHFGVQFWGLGLLASSLTAFYMTRLFVLVFLGEYRGKAHPHESPWMMALPLVVLAVGSAFTGLLGVPHGLHILPTYLANYLEPVLPLVHEAEGPISEIAAMGAATLLAFASCALAFVVFTNLKRAESFGQALKPFKTIFENKFWVDELYQLLFIKPFETVSGFLSRFFDVKIIDGAVHVPGKIVRGGAILLSLFQVGSIQFYLLVMVIGGLCVFWMTLRGGM